MIRIHNSWCGCLSQEKLCQIEQILTQCLNHQLQHSKMKSACLLHIIFVTTSEPCAFKLDCLFFFCSCAHTTKLGGNAGRSCCTVVSTNFISCAFAITLDYRNAAKLFSDWRIAASEFNFLR